jgi:predicted Zn-dependent protease
MAGSVFFKLGRMAGGHVRKARWMWQSVAGSEAEAIQAEHAFGRDLAAVVLEETPRDPNVGTQALLDELSPKLAAVVRNRLHQFQMIAIADDRPTAFALPGGFIFVARSLVDLCDRNKDDIAFILAHEMAHVIRRHAVERMLQQKALNAVAFVAPARGALAAWLRTVGFQALERAYSQGEEFEADELGFLLMRAAGFDPGGAIRMLRCLGELDRRPDPLGLNRYLSTHPPIDERVDRLGRLIAGKAP